MISESLWCSAGCDLETVEVSRLANALEFGYDAVAIVDKGEKYKLVVLNFGDFEYTYFSRSFDSLFEAKYAFLRRFASPELDVWRNIEAQWTPFYFSWDDLDFFTLHLINQQRMMR